MAVHPPQGGRRYTPWFWVGVGSFLLAYEIWLTGTNEHSWCRPDSLIQAHAIWHVLSAVATWGFFSFFGQKVGFSRTESRHLRYATQLPIISRF